jgi:hypothetical protein
VEGHPSGAGTRDPVRSWPARVATSRGAGAPRGSPSAGHRRRGTHRRQGQPPRPGHGEIAVRTLDHDRIAAALEERADYTGWAARLAAAVSAEATPALSGRTEGPDTELDESGAEPGEQHVPETVLSLVEVASTDDGGSVPRMRTPRSTGARVAEAMARTPKPTKTAVARELGISDRTVRRYTNKPTKAG